MKVLVCGGRNFSDKDEIWRALDYAHSHKGIDLVIHGGCRGVDRISGAWAVANGIPVMIFPANWEFHGKKAGPIRNKSMVKFGKPDIVIAFEGGAGTEGMIKIAQSDGISIWRPKTSNEDQQA